MREELHVLNGDALAEQLAENCLNQRLVARECMIDGRAKGACPDAIFSWRKNYLTQLYGHLEGIPNYDREVKAEFEKLGQSNAETVLYLWFEDDLFCQLNMYFVCYLCKAWDVKFENIYWVRPDAPLVYGFAGMNTEQLTSAYENALLLTAEDVDFFANLWKAYQHHDLSKMAQMVASPSVMHDIIRPAIQAHLERYPSEGLGRPERSLLQIQTELQTTDFGRIFQEFVKREAIYGFGDLQVKQLWDALQK